MGKPSIFSKEYERRMKKRKSIILLIILVLIITSIIIFFRKNIYSFYSNIRYKYSKDINKENLKNDDKSQSSEDKAKGQSEQSPPENKEVVEEEKFYEIKLEGGIPVKVSYEEQGKDKKFKYAFCAERKIYFDLSPTSQAMLILDEKTQSIIYIDINGKTTDVTQKAYSSSTTQNTYTKENTLHTTPTYIWSGNPKFLDDNKIFYISQLPYFGMNDKYVWILDLVTLQHRNTNIKGQDIVFGDRNERGLQITIDGVKKYINSEGVLSE